MAQDLLGESGYVPSVPVESRIFSRISAMEKDMGLSGGFLESVDEAIELRVICVL